MANATDSEKKAIKYFTSKKIKFEFQKIIKCGDKYYIADFYFPKLKTILEIDGGYHNNDEQKQKDEIRTKDLEKIGYKVVRMTNGDVRKNKYPISEAKTTKVKSADEKKIKYGKYKGKTYSYLKKECPLYLKFLYLNHYQMPHDINVWVKNKFKI